MDVIFFFNIYTKNIFFVNIQFWSDLETWLTDCFKHLLFSTIEENEEFAIAMIENRTLSVPLKGLSDEDG